MSGDGIVIREKLQLGESCELVVDAGGWRLEFWFHPPDMRYRSDRLVVRSADLVAFRQSLQSAGQRYFAIRPRTPDHAKVEQRFGDVTMLIGGPFDGVCLGGWRVLFRDREGMQFALDLLDRVPGRGETLMEGIRRAEAAAPAKESEMPEPPMGMMPEVAPQQPVARRSILRPPRPAERWSPRRSRPRTSRLSRIALVAAAVLSLALAATVVAERHSVPRDVPPMGSPR